MALTKAQLEALKNTLLASQQPIDASTHRAFVQNVIDEMYDAQSRGDLLAGVQTDSTTSSGDTILLIRSGEMFLVPSSLFGTTGTLAGLSDVVIIDEQEGDILSYNAVEGVWENVVASSLISDDVLLRTTNQSFTGVKSAINTGDTLINGFDLTNNGTGDSHVINIQNNSNTGRGIEITNQGFGTGIILSNSSGGKGISSFNISSGVAINVSNSSDGLGIDSFNGGSGIGINSQNNSTGNGIVSNGLSLATGFNYVGQNDYVNTFTVNKFGAITGLTASLSSDLSAGKLLAGLPVGWVTSNLLEVNGGGLINGNLTANGNLSILGTSSFSGNVTAPTFIGALTGVASGNLALTGGTLTGGLIGTSASFTTGVNMATISGNVGIGTTDPLSKLHVSGADAVIRLVDSNGGTVFLGTDATGAFIRSFTTDSFRYLNAAGNDLDVSSSGNLVIRGSNATKASGTAWINPSDSRLKDSIRPYEKGLSELLRINPKLWSYNKESGFDTTKTHLSPIAQELLEVMPEIVSTYKGELNGEEIELLQVDASDMTWLMVKAIQELNAKVEQLENQTI